jgi:hypothetical protein
MKHVSLRALFSFLTLLIAIAALPRPGKAFAAEPTNQAPSAAAQTRPATNRPTGIEIVPTLERPKNARKLEEKDFGGYVLMYDVYGARPNNMGFSETTDFVTYKDIGRFNEGVMKGTNLSRPKHGAVTYLTLEELKAAAEHWKVDIKLD